MFGFSADAVAPVVQLPIVRVKGGGSVDCVLLGPDSVGFGTHWFGRQLLCAGEGCEGCAWSPPRLFVYRAVGFRFGRNTWRLGLLEWSALTEGRFQAQFAHSGFESAHGVEFKVSRRFSKSPLTTSLTGEKIMDVLPSVRLLSLYQALAVIYCLPVPQSLDFAGWGQSVLPVIRKRLEEAMSRERVE